jgi:hypothetical protein
MEQPSASVVTLEAEKLTIGGKFKEKISTHGNSSNPDASGDDH